MISLIKSTSTPWIVCPKPNPQSLLRLFCFPCAGGLPTAFNSWSNYLPPEVEICSIQLPGRGKRLNESAFTKLAPLVQTLTPIIRDFDDKPFAFLGHSMGAVVAFELARELRRQFSISPVSLFVCSCPAPQKPIIKPPISQLPEAAFIAELCHRYNAIPESIRQDKEMMQIFSLSLRADFTLLETYAYKHEKPLDCPIFVFSGSEDSIVSHKDLVEWRTQTSEEFLLQLFPGDHFFLHDMRSLFFQTLWVLLLETKVI
ncbi:MAG: thioesterase [Hydrococcus sp. CRU_1_1]|nr:thioesterase [Hydrococcus sp. CRU_1_1]